MERGKKKEKLNNNSQQRFYDACATGDLIVVKSLVNRVDVNALGMYGFTLACLNGHANIVDFLNNNPHRISHPNYKSLLHQVSLNSHTDVAAILLSNIVTMMEVDIKRWSETYPWGYVEPIQYIQGFNNACMWGHIEAVKLFLNDEKVDFSLDRTTGFRRACASHIKIMKLLFLDEKIDPFLSFNALYLPMTGGYKKSANYLTGHGIMLDLLPSIRGPPWFENWRWNHINFQFYPEIVKKSIFQFLLIAKQRREEFYLYKDIRLVLISYIIKAGVKEWVIQRKRKLGLK